MAKSLYRKQNLHCRHHQNHLLPLALQNDPFSRSATGLTLRSPLTLRHRTTNMLRGLWPLLQGLGQTRIPRRRLTPPSLTFCRCRPYPRFAVAQRVPHAHQIKMMNVVSPIARRRQAEDRLASNLSVRHFAGGVCSLRITSQSRLRRARAARLPLQNQSAMMLDALVMGAREVKSLQCQMAGSSLKGIHSRRNLEFSASMVDLYILGGVDSARGTA